MIELADAIADSGPFESGLSAMDWVVARHLTNTAAAGIKEGSPSVSYGSAKQAVVVLHGMFESIVRRRDGRPNVWDRISEDASSDLKEVAEALASGERLLFACRTSADPVVIATDRKLLIAEPGGVNSLLWSNAYSDINSLTVSRPFSLTVAFPFVAWRGYEMTVAAGDHQTKLQFDDDKDAATVIAEIWARRRRKREES